MGKPKDTSQLVHPPTGLAEAVDRLAGADLLAALRVRTKGDRQVALQQIDAKVLEALAAQARAGGERARVRILHAFPPHNALALAVRRQQRQVGAEGGAEEGDAPPAAHRAAAQRRAHAGPSPHHQARLQRMRRASASARR